MSSLQITTQSVEHVLSTSTTFWDSVISAGVGSFLAALAVAIFSEWSLRRRDIRLEQAETTKKRRQVEATLNWHTEEIFNRLNELFSYLAFDLDSNPYKRLESNVSPPPEMMLTLANASPEAFIHVQTSLSAINKLNGWLIRDPEHLPKERKYAFAVESFSHAVCALAWLQQSKDYNLIIQKKPYLYLTDAFKGYIYEFKGIIKQSLETAHREFVLDENQVCTNYDSHRHSLFYNALRKN